MYQQKLSASCATYKFTKGLNSKCSRHGEPYYISKLIMEVIDDLLSKRFYKISSTFLAPFDPIQTRSCFASLCQIRSISGLGDLAKLLGTTPALALISLDTFNV